MSDFTESQLSTGVWFSPGFYQAYWKNSIQKSFTSKEILERNELKRHRELWIASIFAAAQSLSGKQHFIGVPADEPPDVEVVFFTEIKTPKGTPATKVSRHSLEVVRCDTVAGEDLLSQIEIKNREPWAGLGLLIYEYGNNGKATDYESVYQALQKIEKVHLTSITVVTEIESTAARIMLPSGSFAVTQLYPTRGQTVLNINDSNAFFRHPEVTKKAGLGTGTEWEDLGNYKLLNPILKPRKTKL